jgi:hypothetical protein
MTLEEEANFIHQDRTEEGSQDQHHTESLSTRHQHCDKLNSRIDGGAPRLGKTRVRWCAAGLGILL